MLGIDVAKSTVESISLSGPGPYHLRGEHSWTAFEIRIDDSSIVRRLRSRVVRLHRAGRRPAENCSLQRTVSSNGVTDGATARRAFPFDTARGYPIRDSDGIWGDCVTRRIESLGIDEVITAPASPWQNAYVERMIGTLRRELLTMSSCSTSGISSDLCRRIWITTIRGRTHQSLNSDAPDGRPVRVAKSCNVVEFAQPAHPAFTHVYLLVRLHEYSGRTFLLFFIHLDSRKVEVSGLTPHPNERWMQQIARNVTMDDWGFLNNCRYLIHDRDTKYC